jgi:hypothetical protein
MENNITQNLQEIFRKYRAKIDNEPYLPKRFTVKSWSDLFAEKIKCKLEEEMIKQKFCFQNKIHLPTQYVIQLSSEDNKEFCGYKREILIQGLNSFVGNWFRLLSVDALTNNFIQLKMSKELKKGEIAVTHQWEKVYTPEINFNQIPQNTNTSNFSEETIIAPAFWENDNDFETAIRKSFNKLFSLQIWRGGNYQNNLPVFQNEITLGRSVNQHISLQDDLEISRNHAVLKYQTENTFNLLSTGRNPILVGENALTLFAGQSANCGFGEMFQIGSYCFRLTE